MQSDQWVWKALAADVVIVSLWSWGAFRVRWLRPLLPFRVMSDIALLAGCPISLILVQRLVDAQNPPGLLEHVWIHVGVLLPFLGWLVSVGVGFLLAGGVRRARQVGVGHAA